MSTEKLYDSSPYETEFEATVLEITPAGDGLCNVILDRTLFFPEEGGQSPDTGLLGGYAVTYVSIKDETITHTIRCDAPDLKEGSSVKGSIDWPHRFSNMQNHSGEHILSGLLHTGWDSDNVGFHLSDNTVTLDTSRELTEEDLKKLEAEANHAIYRDLPVTCRYYTPSEAAGIDYRSKKEFTGDVRLVTIPGVDICACCAPHVSRTGEIGIIKIIKAIKYKGGMRLTILSGARAYHYLASIQSTADTLSHLLSESIDTLPDAVNRLLDDNNSLKIKIKNISRARLEADIAALPEDTKAPILFTDALDNVVQRNAVNELTASHSGICAVFASDDKGGYNYICAYPGGDARTVSSLLHEKLNARGGGSEAMVQGNVASSEAEIRALLDSIIEK
ncbi:MAG: alanyl-tRNA editing protein [Lachnospiraceae bacterium]|nr:alanyl-tRNA editing protein [Lachnospiraceae bacterium]